MATAVYGGSGRFGDERWARATRRNPCPICEKPDWCQLSPDGELAKCMRVFEGAFETGTQRDGQPYALHRLSEPRPAPAPRPMPAPAPTGDPLTNRAVYGLVYRWCAGIWPEAAAAELARRFGPRAAAVRERFPLGYCPDGPALREALAREGRAADARRAGVLGAQLGRPVAALRERIVFAYARDGAVWDLRGAGIRARGDREPRAKSLLGAYEARGADGVFFNHDALGGAHGGTIHLAGGEWKTIALALAGLPAVGTPGEGPLFAAQLEALREAGVRAVVLHIDAEDPKRPGEPSPGRRLGAVKGRRLAEAGFAVRVAEPPRAPGAPKVDPDALLLAEGEAAVRAYAAAAVPLADFLRELGMAEPAPPAVVPLRAAGGASGAGESGPVPFADVPAGSPLGVQLAARAVAGTPYHLHPEGAQVYKLRPAGGAGGEGGGTFQPVNRWGAPRLVRAYKVARAGERATENMWYEIEVSGRPTEGVKPATEAEVNDGSWAAKWGGLPITSRRQRDEYANVVKAQVDLDGIPIAEARDVTGWYREAAGGAWRYVLPDGRTLPAAADAEPPPLTGYTLPPQRAEAFRAGLAALPVAAPTAEDVRALLDFYRRGSPHGHLLITVGAAARGLAHTFVPASTALLSEGEAESGKTASGKHARGLIGPSPYRSEADCAFKGTATAMENDVAPLHDAPVVVDNFRIKPTDGAAEMRTLGEQLDRLIIAGESGEEMRPRAGRDGRRRQGNRVGTLLLINGEQLPETLLSTLRRIALLPYEKGRDIATDVLGDEEAAMQPRLTRCGHAVLAWLAARANEDVDALRQALGGRQDGETRRLMVEAQGRRGVDATLYRSVPSNWAQILAGLWLLDTALAALGVDAPSFVEAARPHVVAAMNRQLDRMNGAQLGADGLGAFGRLAQRLRERIRDHVLIAGQTWQLADVLSGEREAPREGGYQPTEWGFHGAATERTPVVAGYVDSKRRELYLLPKAVEQLRRMAEREPGCEHLKTEDALWKAAEVEGWIARRGDGRHRGVQLGAQGRLGRGWALRLDRWLDKEPEGEPPAAGGRPGDTTEGPEATEPDAAAAGPAPAPPEPPPANARYGPGDIADPFKPSCGPAAPDTGYYPCAVCGRDRWFPKDRLQVCRECRPAYEAAFSGRVPEPG